MIVIEYRGGGDTRGLVYSLGAKGELFSLGADYKWFGAAFGVNGEIATALHFEFGTTFRIPAIDELVTEADALLPEACRPDIAGDYRGSGCWPGPIAIRG